MEPFLLLQQYHRDRHKLLEFILLAGLIRAPSGASVDLSGVDLDTISADYVLECVKSGGVFDLAEATKTYSDGLDFPVMINSSSGNSYFLLSKPELSGSPPRRVVPQVEVITSNNSSWTMKQPDHLAGIEIEQSGIEGDIGDIAATVAPYQSMEDANTLSLGLPTLSTGLSDDDMRVTAYEVLLASVMFSEGPILFSVERKKERKSKFLMGLRSKREGLGVRNQFADSHFGLLDMIRIQMEISEPMDACTKQGLRNFYSRMMHERVDIPQISLELLSSICKSDFHNERSYTQWQRRQANILEELLHESANLVDDGHTTLCLLLSKLRNTEEWATNIDPDGRAEILTALRKFASRLSSMLGKFGVPGETYYWTCCYHVNVRLYEKLLCSVFDVLEDGQVVEEAEEILMSLKLTWLTLGITQKIHNALYGWVLFQQFVGTGEPMLLKYTILEMQKVLSTKDDEGNEEAYVNSLICSTKANGSKRTLCLVDAILISINTWCSSQLQDYHLHFSQEKSVNFESVVTLAIITGTCFSDQCTEIKYNKPIAGIEVVSELLQRYVERSIHAAFQRVVDFLDAKSKLEQKHPLVTLANELKLIAEKESTAFIPVLCRHHARAEILSSMLLHQLYGEQLKPFLEGVSYLSESVRSVLAASDSLEHCLTHIICSANGDGLHSPIINCLHPYQIRDICAPLILDWVNAQSENILQWTKRAIQIEDWEPLSSQQRQATSIIEVIRIVEEAIDQFFNLTLPMDIIHLRCILIGIVRSLDAYLLHMVSQLVDKNKLYPSTPALTRYKESVNPFMKKKYVETIVLEEKLPNQLNDLTASKLCVRLNSLHYIQEQLDTLEDAIKNSWMLVWPVNNQLYGAKEGLSTSSESVDELFTIFDDIRRSTIGATEMICDFMGTRIIFWDMRDSFLFSLYRGSVDNARMEINVPQLDRVLDHICDLIDDTLRDPVILSICRASMDGYVWVMMDGGPSRMFSETDVTMMQEDLKILKDLFVADGHGLPRVVVEQEGKLAQQILDLYSLKTEAIVKLLISASEQISYGPDPPKKPGSRFSEDADTLLRVLCHKKDKDASRFLKMQYQLPRSSEYMDTPERESTSHLLPDLLKRSTSFSWTEKGQKSFRTMKKKLQEATSEIKHTPW